MTCNETIIAHGVNCCGVFNSGVAGAIKDFYPFAKEKYHAKYDTERWNLGEVQLCSDPSTTKQIINCATQSSFGKDPKKQYASYEAIKTCMQKVKNYAKERNLTIAIPKIGCGLGNANWEKVELILLEIFNDYDITVYIL